MKELLCIITGPEKNGTTYFKTILDSHPDIFSGFETGLLYRKNFNKCVPFNKWIHRSDHHWGIPRSVSFTGVDFKEKYEMLFEHKGSYFKESKVQNLIKESKYIVDKTPRYIRNLKHVRENSNIDIPIFVIIKSFRNYYRDSVVKKPRLNNHQFYKMTKNALRRGLQYIDETKDSENIHLFSHEDIIGNETQFVSKIKQILRNRINTNHEMSMDAFRNKMKKIQPDRPDYHWSPPKPIALTEDQKNIFHKLETEYDILIQRNKQIIT